MPSRRVHNYTCRVILGNSFDRVHAEIDRPFKWLGRRHRILNHTPAEAALIARRVSSDPRAVSAAMLHLHYDTLCSKDPQLRKMLEDRARWSVHAAKHNSQRPPFVNLNQTILRGSRPKPVRPRRTAPSFVFPASLKPFRPPRPFSQPVDSRPPSSTLSALRRLLRRQILRSMNG